jgi:hypothetical protein
MGACRRDAPRGQRRNARLRRVLVRGAGERAGPGLASTGVVVDCWIGVVQEVDRRVVRLAGRLTVAQIPELLNACADSGPVELDLSELVSADVAGIDALRRVRAGGVSLVGAVGYIQLKLDSPAHGPTSAPLPKGRRST